MRISYGHTQRHGNVMTGNYDKLALMVLNINISAFNLTYALMARLVECRPC